MRSLAMEAVALYRFFVEWLDVSANPLLLSVGCISCSFEVLNAYPSSFPPLPCRPFLGGVRSLTIGGEGTVKLCGTFRVYPVVHGPSTIGTGMLDVSCNVPHMHPIPLGPVALVK